MTTTASTPIPADKAAEYAAHEADGYTIAADHPCPGTDYADADWAWHRRQDGQRCGAPTIAPRADRGEEGYFCPACGLTSV